jgi:hypothetical protein
MSVATSAIASNDQNEPRVGVEQCSDCEGDNRWENLWEDVLNTLERMKTQITTEAGRVNFDVQRIRAAFNCQSPGNETLSAEQIVVEHAYEQAKSVLSCTQPRGFDQQEEVVDERVEIHHDSEDEALDVQESKAAVASPAEPKERTDLLDLSVSSPMELISPVEVNSATEATTVSSVAAMPPADLLDISLANEEVAGAPQPTIIASFEDKAPMDLLDLSLAQDKSRATPMDAPDLLDLSFVPEQTVPVAPVAAAVQGESMPDNQNMLLQDIVEEKFAQTIQEPVASPAVHDLADLLDFPEDRMPAPVSMA